VGITLYGLGPTEHVNLTCRIYEGTQELFDGMQNRRMAAAAAAAAVDLACCRACSRGAFNKTMQLLADA
jgi:hypothetical protein